MNELIPVEYSNQRILTTRQIAEGYETDTKIISNNYNRNKERYVQGVHYYCLEGEEKREFLNRHQIEDGSQNAATLYLWTEKGALLHAKSLNTDRAWDVYNELVENYFRPKAADISALSPEMRLFKHLFDSLAATQVKQAETERKVEAASKTIAFIKDTLIERDSDWRKWVTDTFNQAVSRSPEKDYKAIRLETYEILERRAHCRLGERLSNMKRRMYAQGLPKTKVENATRVDVIEADPKLKEIYTAIVKELSIRYAS